MLMGTLESSSLRLLAVTTISCSPSETEESVRSAARESVGRTCNTNKGANRYRLMQTTMSGYADSG